MNTRRLLPAALALCGALAAAEPVAFRPEPGEKAFLDLMEPAHHPLEAREAAKAYLAKHPGSFLACEVIGMVYLHTDGDLPKALYFFTRARTLMEARYGSAWVPGTPYGYYSAILGFLYDTQYRMERYRDALATQEARERQFTLRQPAAYAWPLMKLGRYREAREKIDEALRSGVPDEVNSALNTLGAMEAELDHPDQAMATQLRLLEMDRPRGANRDVTFIRNAADTAVALGQLPRAEQFLLEATEHFSPGAVSNPWGDLAALYLVEERWSEAMDAVKRMHLWAFHSHPLTAETRWNLRQTLTGALLMYCGCTDEALTIARRLLERPDRHATGSSRGGQREAGTQLFAYQVLQDALARDGEDFSYAPWKRRPGILLRSARHAWEAALVLRRAGSLLMASRDRLSQSLRGLGAQSIVDVPGGEVLLPRLAGPGVAEAELRSLLARTGPAADRERGFVLFGLGAARMERGDTRGALEALDAAEPQLPAEFAHLHTQILALRARALLQRGDAAGALPVLAAILERDGGEVRRQGLALPCRIQAGPGPMAAQAASLLKGSPRLQPGRGGFRVVVEPTGAGGLQGGLDTPQGTALCRFQVPPGPDPDATVREFCRQFHRKAFGPRIDLSQQQIRSLEGSTLAAESAEEQLKGILGD